MEPLLHFLIPVLLLIAFFPKLNKWLILKLSILTVIMDFDIFIPNAHRIAFHNIFFVVGITLLVYFIFGELESKIALFFLGSHLVFDMFMEGPALFWPFYHYLFNLTIKLTGFLPWNIYFKFRLIPLSEFVVSKSYEYLSPIGSLILIVIGIVVIAKYFSIRKIKKRI